MSISLPNRYPSALFKPTILTLSSRYLTAFLNVLLELADHDGERLQVRPMLNKQLCIQFDTRIDHTPAHRQAFILFDQQKKIHLDR